MLDAAVGQSTGSAVGSLAIAAGRGIFNSLKHKYVNVKNLDKNFDELRKQARHLYDRAEDITREIDRNIGRMEMTRECTTWIDEVKTVKNDIGNLATRYENANKCLCRLYRFSSLLKLSKDIVKKTREVVDLKDRMNPERIQMTEKIVPFEKKHANKIKDVPSLKENVEKLLGHLRDKSIKRIGVWGTPGVGKTTIMETLNNKVGNMELFDMVIWVTVSNDGSVGSIQQVLVERLKLNVEGINTEPQVANIISQALERKKYLLLLDEVFSEIKLHEVGIHDSHEHGKWVLASRDRSVCNEMDTQEEIRVKRLAKTEASELFREIVGDAFDRPRIKPIAQKILKECGDLPQVIKAVARTLRNEQNESIWLTKLSKLRSSSESQLQGMKEMFNAFKLVYDDLSEDKKKCLLYGALFPSDHEIYQDYLMECWKAEQYILDAETLRKARDEGHYILKFLIDTSLLERCRSVDRVKMPMIFRRMALKTMMSDDGCRVLVRESEDAEEESLAEDWRNANMISLMYSDLQTLPARPGCCNISTLFLQRNTNLTTIPESFFDHMSGLKILDLNHTGIESLPRSVSNLVNLRGLYLNDCGHLMNLPDEIVELKYLEILDICRIGNHRLPIMIGELVGLKCLRISFISHATNQNHLSVLPSPTLDWKVFEKLTLLEELTIDVNHNDLGWNTVVDLIVREVAKMAMLTTLCFYFPTVSCLANFVGSSKSWQKRSPQSNGNIFRSFKIAVGSHMAQHPYGLDISGCSVQRHLRYCAGEGSPEVIKEVLRQSCALELIGHRGVSNLSDFGVDEMHGLEVCVIEKCEEMSRIVGNNMSSVDAFPFLEKLHMIELQRLHCIWEGSVGSRCLAKLKVLTLNRCLNLKKILSLKMAHQLPELQFLRIEDCPEIAEVFEANDQSGQINQVIHHVTCLLPKLKVLELISLPKLISICHNNSLDWPSLRRVEIRECRQLKTLCLSTENAKQLESIKCSETWWNDLVQEDDLASNLHSLCRFNV